MNEECESARYLSRATMLARLCSKSRRDRAAVRPRTILQWIGRLPDVNKSCDFFRRFQSHALQNGGMVGAPLRNPVRDIASRMRRYDDIHADGARGQLLFPDRNG